MPLYEYKCDKCDQVFEVIQKFSDQPLTVHESCGGAVERLLSRSAFQLKGTGWYATDYARSGGAKKDSTPDSKPDSKSGASSPPATKSESTKPAASVSKDSSSK